MTANNLAMVEQRRLKDATLEAKRARALRFVKLNPDVPIYLTAKNLGVGEERLKKWVREAGICYVARLGRR